MLRLCGAELVQVPAVPYSNPNNYQHVGRQLAEQLKKTEKNGVIIIRIGIWNGRDLYQFGPAEAQHVFLFLALRLRNDNQCPVTARIGDQGQADAGIAGGASTTSPPGRNSPRFSASTIICRPARSFTEPPGFMNSALPRMMHPAPWRRCCSRISGVLPMASFAGFACPVPGLMRGVRT